MGIRRTVSGASGDPAVALGFLRDRICCERRRALCWLGAAAVAFGAELYCGVLCYYQPGLSWLVASLPLTGLASFALHRYVAHMEQEKCNANAIAVIAVIGLTGDATDRADLLEVVQRALRGGRDPQRSADTS